MAVERSFAATCRETSRRCRLAGKLISSQVETKRGRLVGKLISRQVDEKIELVEEWCRLVVKPEVLNQVGSKVQGRIAADGAGQAGGGVV